MAEDLSDTMGRFRRFVEGIPEFSDATAVEIALQAGQLVNSRIVDTGIAADGSPLVNEKNGKDYSDTEVSVSAFYDAAIPLPKARAKQMARFISYKDYKQAIGRYRGHRDMMLTGAMWKNTGLVEKQVTPKGFEVVIKGRTKETQDKLDRNSRLAGVDLLELSPVEEETLAGDLGMSLQLYMDRMGI